MKSGTRKITTRLAAMLLGVAVLPAHAASPKDVLRSGPSFNDYDSNKDGYLSLDEFNARGKDDLAFKAADINGDQRLDRSEFDKYLARQANDQPKPGSGASGEPKPAPPTGY